MIHCPNCGANPRFDIASQKLLCPQCGSSFDVESFPEETTGAGRHEMPGEYAGEPDKMQVIIYTCSQCGAELMSTDTDAAAFCSYCGAHQILEERLSVQERPKRIIPFTVTKEDCKKAYVRKLRRRLFAPRELKDPAYIEEFRGIYMPYWSYTFSQKGKITLDGTQEHREGDYKIIDNYGLSVDADNTFSGITHDASTTFDDAISESLAPFDVRKSVPFRTGYLSGFYADIPDLRKTVYRHESAAMAARDTVDRIQDMKEFKKYSFKDLNDVSAVSRTLTKVESIESAMFPVWFLSYRKKDRVAYAAINGQTGKMTADIPIAPVRYLIGVAIVAVVIWLLLQTGNISSLRGTVLAVIFGAMAGSLVYGMVVHKLNEKMKNREWENAIKDTEEEDTVPEKAEIVYNQPGKKNAGRAKKKKRKRQTNNKNDTMTLEKEKPSIGIFGTLVIWLILIGIAGVLVIAGLGGLIMVEPLLAAVYVQLGFPEDGPKRGRISNWALGISGAFGALIWAINPYVDILYYGCCVLMMVCVVWCFFDALYYYNQLMTRPLPQFEKKGGDDNA